MKSILALVLLACGCESDASSTESADVTVAKSSLARASDPSSADVAALGGSNRAFAFDLYHQIAQTSAGQNIVFSPYSLSTAFAMTYAGAENNTRDQIAAVMHFDLPDAQLHEAFNATERALPTLIVDDQPVQLAINNALWMANGTPVEMPFLDTLALNYGAGVFMFRGEPEVTRLAINAEVSKETAMLIPALLPEGAIDSLTRFVLTDTVYLNAKWATSFDARATHDGTFTKLDGSSLTTPMMYTSQHCSYASGDGYQAIALSYADRSSLQFIAVLPDEGNFDALEASLDRTWFDALNTQLSEDGAAITLPKFDFGQHVSMRSELEALGMSDPFVLGTADFSGMTSEQVAIKDVFQQATIKVAEEGTVATAVTAVVINSKSAPPQAPHSVTFDRPFLFAISDRSTGALLFLGRVVDPTAQ